ncbi:betabeta-2-microglobulin [Podarcis lilfordi]|uniref:Betabeta-2-microglobulin n=1 Tax=Podarcis lilfordi TaxID=74358 RepID=A0AA35LC90_9SAUR|nr:betabeta-2-microglobulin [Podarcis lilfordi]
MAKALMLSCLALVLLVGILEATPRTPNVQVYSRYPVEKGKENIVNCYVDNFHPPKINITIEKGGKPLEDVKQSLQMGKKLPAEWNTAPLLDQKLSNGSKSNNQMTPQQERSKEPAF